MATTPLKGITIVATFISAGVSAGASGFAIVGGKIVKIPPHGPAFKKITEASVEIAGGQGKTKTARRTKSS
jgi:hypothetical protein